MHAKVINTKINNAMSLFVTVAVENVPDEDALLAMQKRLYVPGKMKAPSMMYLMESEKAYLLVLVRNEQEPTAVALVERFLSQSTSRLS
jgi:hypothetical protein